ncbi:hypothetical protein GCM10012284_37300 [Mangrovihabitans endophyticus]|uniref:DUF3105 domain-containing protein n=2 Tax=Mangrovihabitans endophyticus TaxID=1751298 RepID=A0A8J3FQM1_9ACTN|nr:hypothetical protein GCM10012284_37300 [Mangrovihabitans endophyticus]
MSTPGPQRTPSTVKVDSTSGQGKPPASKGGPKAGAKAGSKPAGKRPAGKGGGGKGRKPVTPVKVNGGRNWGPIAMVVAVVLIAAGIIGYGVYASMQGTKTWEERAADIKGIVNYRDQHNPKIDARNHKDGVLTYVTNPPVGGDHNPTWQNCMGDIYTEPIANEHAVHSLEHGAVWVTYKEGLPAAQVDKLAARVQGKDYMFMSPVANLDKNVSLQAWGYQLKVDNADDERIDEFIKDLRQNASVETGAVCSGGNTNTGPVTNASNGTTMGGGN